MPAGGHLLPGRPPWCSRVGGGAPCTELLDEEHRRAVHQHQVARGADAPTEGLRPRIDRARADGGADRGAGLAAASPLTRPTIPQTTPAVARPGLAHHPVIPGSAPRGGLDVVERDDWLAVWWSSTYSPGSRWATKELESNQWPAPAPQPPARGAGPTAPWPTACVVSGVQRRPAPPRCRGARRARRSRRRPASRSRRESLVGQAVGTRAEKRHGPTPLTHTAATSAGSACGRSSRESAMTSAHHTASASTSAQPGCGRDVLAGRGRIAVAKMSPSAW